MLEASIITTCKGRLPDLKLTLPSKRGQMTDLKFEVLVVDYDDPQRSLEFVRLLDAPALNAVRVDPQSPDFNLSRARNCGAKHAAGRILCFVDADVFLSAVWLDIVVQEFTEHPETVLIRNEPQDLARNAANWGTAAVLASAFHELRGYDEKFQTWGHEEVDLYHRASSLGSVRFFRNGLILGIRHGDERRTRYYPDKDIRASNRRNIRYARQRRGEVNPTEYGRGVVETFFGGR